MKNVILPNKDAILANKKTGKKRYIASLFTEISGMNSKENPAVGNLAENVEFAIAQEAEINQNVASAIGNLTSNIGMVIQDIKNDNGET